MNDLDLVNECEISILVPQVVTDYLPITILAGRKVK